MTTTPRFTLHPEGHFTDESRLYRAADGSYYKLQLSPTLNRERRVEHAEAITLAASCALDPAGGAWSLPTIEELVSLVDYSRIELAIDEQLVSDTKPNFYWSASLVASDADYAWGVYFNDGGVGYCSRNLNGFVRAVRRVSAVPASQ